MPTQSVFLTPVEAETSVKVAGPVAFQMFAVSELPIPEAGVTPVEQPLIKKITLQMSGLMVQVMPTTICVQEIECIREVVVAPSK